MPELLLLVGDLARARNDNHRRLAEGFQHARWNVTRADHDSLEVHGNRLWLADREPAFFDLVWPLGFGQHATFFDRMQLLNSLPATRFVTAPNVLLNLHGKHRWLELMPETHTSTRPDYLYQVLSSGGDWVLKPTAGSFGRDVQLFRAGTATLQDITRLCSRLGNGYLIAQRYVPEILDGEKRTLVAGGRLIGTYLRIPAADLTSNLAAGGRPERTTLSPEETAFIQPIARTLGQLGAGFAAIDTVHPFLMEVNVANPGGLATLEDLEGVDYTGAAVEAIIDWSSSRR